jgi:hypothetical protein
MTLTAAERKERYVKSAVDAECDGLANTTSGRNAALNNAACALGSLVAAGVLSSDDAEKRLLAACEVNGYTRQDGVKQVLATIKSGLEAGKKTPRQKLPSELHDVSSGPLTVEDFAAHKNIDPDVLKFYDWRNTDRGIEIDYKRRDGGLARTRVRCAIAGEKRFFWKKEDAEIIAYEPDGGELAREQGYLVICEGESDTVSLLFAEIPALGIPGADFTKTIQSHHLVGVRQVFICVDVNAVGDPDSGAEKFIPRVRARLHELGFKGE